MTRFLVLLLVLAVLVPVALAAFDRGPASGELKDRLAYAHQMVKFWWSIYIEYRTPNSLKMLYFWRMECTKLMAESGTAGGFVSSSTNR